MPNQTICASCGGQAFDIAWNKGSDWLSGVCSSTGVETKVPNGVWFQKPETSIPDFIIKVGGNLPEDSLDWKVDEDKVRNYEKIFGPQGMLFSNAESGSDAAQRIGLTREQWKMKYRQVMPSGETFYPDPIILWAIAFGFWDKYGPAALVTLPGGEKAVINWDYMMKLRTEKENPLQVVQRLIKARDAGLITKEEFESKKTMLLGGKEADPVTKLSQLKEMLNANLITEKEYDMTKDAILLKMK